jgi:alanine dehydrogenase
MKIGCVKEIKNNEFRVGIIPDAVNEYVRSGHEVFIESSAGIGSSIADTDYIEAGAKILPDAKSVWEMADMIIKVKEPLEVEYNMMREGQIVYTYFHFAASESLTRACLERKIIAVAYETVRDQFGGLPLLKPMSEIAGSMAPLVGSYFMMKPFGGRGILPMGVPGVQPANVVVLGGGIVGRNAARVSAGLGCKVTVFDTNIRTLTELKSTMPANVFTQFSSGKAISAALPYADIVIGAVLIPGDKAPKLVNRNNLSLLEKGSVIVDVAIDQGGCFETSHATTHEFPVYEIDGIIHYCVANMPGAFSKTATISLNNATLAYGIEIANKGILEACRTNDAIRAGLNTYRGRITCAAVANCFNMMELFTDPQNL